MVFQNNVLSGAAGSGTTVHTIDQSIRFNEADSAYMYRTPSSASNRKTFTISFWFKTTVSGSFQTLIGAYDNSSATDSTYFGIWQGSTGNMGMGTWNTNQISTTRKIRDPSAWFHCVYAIDTTDTLSTDRVKLYINGQRETDITYNAPSLNHDFGWNLNQVHSIGRINYLTGSGPYYTNGYLTEIYHIDGQALDCNSFGEFNSSGIWIPKDASGLTFGTNGFHIDGRDASDLGDDESGNGNDFSTSGLATHDQMADSPTNNFVTINPLTAGSYIVTSNGNLEATASSNISYHRLLQSTLGITPSDTGKYYFEWQVPSSLSASSVDMIGFCDLNYTETDHDSLNSGSGWGIGYKIGTGAVYAGSGWTANSFTFGGFVASAYYGFAYDASTGKLYIYENGTALNSGAHVATFDKSSTIAPGASFYNNNNYVYKLFNGAQTSLTNSNFNYAPPTGYVAINTKNLGS